MNLIKWGRDRKHELGAQLNMNDGGATADTVRRNVQPTPPPAPTPPRPQIQQPVQQPSRPTFKPFDNSLTRGLSRAVDQVNPFDNNRTWQQTAPTQSKSTFQQAGQLGGQIVRQTVPASARMLNTAVSQYDQVKATKDQIGAQALSHIPGFAGKASRDLNIANQKADIANNSFKRGSGGILNVGSMYNADEAKRGDLRTGIKRIGGGTLDTGLEAASLMYGANVGGSVVKNGVVQGVKRELPALAKSALINTAQGGVSAKVQGASNMDALKAGALSGTLGTVGDVGLGIAGGAIGAPIHSGIQNAVAVAKSKALTRNMTRSGDIMAPLQPNQVVRDTAKLNAINELRQQLTTGNNSPGNRNALLPAIHQVKNENGIDLVTGSNADRLKRATQFLENNGEAIQNGVGLQSAPKPSLMDRLKAPFNEQVGGAKIGDIPGLNKFAKDAPMDSNKVARELSDNLRMQRAMRGETPSEAPVLSRSSDAPDVPPVSPSNIPKQVEGQPLNRLDSQSLPNSTPRQMEIKESTAPFSNEQSKIVSDYADMLKGMGEGNGVTVTPDGRRISSNLRTAETKGQSRVDWNAEAERQLRNGNAQPDIQKVFRELENPEFRSLAQSAEASTAKGSVGDKFTTDPLEGFRQKVQQRSGESNIPVRKMTQEGDVVTATNVNPNIKAGEKRFSVDDKTGELIPDKKGATSLFTDNEGRVTGFRVGREYFSAKQLGNLSDVNGYGSSMATMRRNVERGFGKETGAKVNEFLVDHQQHQATKMIERHLALKHGLQEQADMLGIDFAKNTKQAKKVSAGIQDYGEGRINKGALQVMFGPEQAAKMVEADKWFKSQYNTLLDEMNTTLEQYGYDPVPKRKNYYTHFQEPKLWESFGLKMQEIKNLASPTLQDASPDAPRGLISNKLAGQSEFTLPNKKFNKFALQRKGDVHTANAFKAFETYLSPTLNNIYMTPSIARARVLTRAIAQDADIVGKDANHIIVQTKEWANRLAGKTNRFDRPLADTAGGQQYLKAAQWVQRKAGANTIVGNLSTAVMQPILLAQTAGKSGYKNTILAAMQEMSSAHSANAPIRQSEFLKRRYSDLSAVTAGKGERVADVLNKPLEVVEETAARISWNAAHNDALSQGLSGQKAIKYADVQTEKTLAGRSIGERPELYESKAAAPLTMYQLEVNNYWQQMAKEMTKPQAAKALVAAFGLNLLLQNATGRSVGFNPIDASIDSYKETQKQEKSTKDKGISIAQRVGGEVVDNTPLVGPLANLVLGNDKMKKVFGPSTNVGRFGVGSPLSAIASTTKVGNTPIPQNLLLPFGGGQVKKTVEGAQALYKGKLTDKAGDTTVDIPRTPANVIRGLAFGPSAIPEVNKYYNNTGKKKADQETVPNQLNSDAGTQGLNGLTKQQQETLNYQVNPKDRATFLKSMQQENKVGRAVDKEVDTFKNSNTSGMQRSDGKYAAMVDGKVETFDSKSDFDKKTAKKKLDKTIEDFKNSKEKTKEINGEIYLKKKNGDVTSKSKSEFEYDKVATKRKLEMDRATASNNLDGYVKLASDEIDAMEKLKSQYDPETEQDKIDALTLKQENLSDKANGYLEKGYIRKASGGKKGKKIPSSLYSQAFTTPKLGKAMQSTAKVSAPRMPSFGGVKTPRVASKPRNRMNVTSTKTRIS